MKGWLSLRSINEYYSRPIERPVSASMNSSDFVLIFGDDQYEVFKEDCIPPFAVFAIDNIQIKDSSEGRASIKGSQQIGNYLVRGLVTKGFDVACCWRLRNQENYGHAFITTIQYLDLDKRGFDYPMIPVTVNCYGSDLRVPNDQYPVTKGIGRLLENASVPPPPSPPPWRCYDLGKAVAEIIKQSPWRAVVIGLSSWSHASLTTKNHYLWPDVETDRQRFAELKSGEHRKWRGLRIEYDGTLCHVTSGGDRQEPIYEDNWDRRAFLTVLRDVVEGFGWNCYAYCLIWRT